MKQRIVDPDGKDPSVIESIRIFLLSSGPSLTNWARRHQRARNVQWLLALVLVIALGARYARKAVQGNDFDAYYTAAVAAAHGDHHLYDAHQLHDAAGPGGWPYLYPPTLAILLIPSTILPFEAVAITWVVLNLLLLPLTIWFCIRMTTGKKRGKTLLLGSLALLCVARTFDSEFGNGQANLLVLFFLTLCGWQFTRGKKFTAGMALAVGAALKATPLLLCGYFLFKREWRALSGCLAGLVFLVLVLPAIVWSSPAKAWETNVDWVDRVVLKSVSVTKAETLDVATASDRNDGGAIGGYSLRALVFRLLTPSDIRYISRRNLDDHVFINIANLRPEQAEFIYRALSVLILLISVWACGMRRPRDPQRLSLEFSIFILVMVMISPLSRKAHFVAVLLPCVCAANLYFQGKKPWVFMSLLAIFATFNLTASGILGRVGYMYTMGYGALCLGSLVLWVTLVVEARTSSSGIYKAGEKIAPLPKK